MNAEQSHLHDTSSSDFAWTAGLRVPPWLLRLQVGWVESEIHEVERLLDDQFGISEMAPVHAQHSALLRERDALMEQLLTSAVHG